MAAGKRLRVLFFPCGGLVNASARTRCYAYLPYFAEHGVDACIGSYSYHKYDKQKPNCRGAAGKLRQELLPLRIWYWLFRTDVLFLQKLRLPRFHIRVARWLGKKIVYDIDDAIYLRQPEIPGAVETVSAELDADADARIRWILNLADLAVVSGNELRDYARRYCRSVAVVPSSLPHCVQIPSQADSVPVIGWVGAPENQRYLRFLSPVFCRLLDEIPDLEIRIMTSEPADPPLEFKHRFIPWSREAESSEIPLFTVGVAPLIDDPWCRAKINFKALVYLSHGVPVIMSPIGFPLDELGRHRDRMTAVEANEWHDKLHAILTNPETRRDAAAAGIEIASTRFTAGARVAQLVQALAGGSR